MLAFRVSKKAKTLVVVNLSRLPNGRARSLTLCRFRAHGGIQSKLFPANQSFAIPDHARPHAHYCSSCAHNGGRARSDKRVVPTIRIERISKRSSAMTAQTFRARILPDYLRTCRVWRKARTIRAVQITEEYRFQPRPNPRASGLLSQLSEGRQKLALPVRSLGAAANQILRSAPHAEIARFSRDARSFCRMLFGTSVFREDFSAP